MRVLERLIHCSLETRIALMIAEDVPFFGMCSGRSNVQETRRVMADMTDSRQH